MPRKIADDIDKQILLETIKQGAENDLQKISTLQIAKVCHISESVIFNHFGSKLNLLSEASTYINSILLDYLKGLLQDGCTEEQFASNLLDFAISLGNKILYFNRYFSTEGYSPLASNENNEFYIEFSRNFAPYDAIKNLSDEEVLVRWNYAVVNLFFNAERFICGLLTDTPQMRAFIIKLIFTGMNHSGK